MIRRLVASLTSVAAIVSVAVVLPASPASAVATPTKVWERQLGGQIIESSPNVGDIGGQPAISIGAHDGNLYSVSAANGADIGGWPRQLGRALDSSPAIADVDSNGSKEVFIGSGVADGNFNGSFWSFNNNGTTRWNTSPADASDASHAVFSSPAVGDVNGDNRPDVSGFSLGLRGWSFDAASGNINPRWPIYTDDSVFSSPAIADIDGDGLRDYVVGGDSAAGGVIDNRGGVVRAVRGDGRVLWQFFTNETVRSSPVVADITGDGQPEIIFGTGNFWTESDSNRIFALDRTGHLLWVRDLGAQTLASPAVADVDGNGTLDVIEGTWAGDANTRGRVTVLDGAGNVLPNWNRHATGNTPGENQIIGQVSTADFDNDGGQDLLVPASFGAIAYSGKTGAELFRLNDRTTSYQNAPWIGDLDNNGRLDIVMGGTKSGQGILTRWQMPDGVARLGTNGYSQFRKDAAHTGTTMPVPVPIKCEDYPGQSYTLNAADGGIFNFCSTFFGSMGGKPLNQPIVGSAQTPNKQGYWQVAADGGIFSFGNAAYKGSTGGTPLNAPIVAMAPTPSGNGYWLVARDGGIFTFGDAVYKGSTGGMALNQPIVGMTPTASGQGYYLVASDGGVFTFGDARFQGSTGGQRLNAPVVGIAASPSGGYWLVASDGGIFSYNAQFFGSAGSLRLAKPVVGISIANNGTGYRLVASDGGVFNYGNAPYLGSTAFYSLNSPIVNVN